MVGFRGEAFPDVLLYTNVICKREPNIVFLMYELEAFSQVLFIGWKEGIAVHVSIDQSQTQFVC